MNTPFIVILAVATLATRIDSSSILFKSPRQFTFIAAVDGKTYMAEPSASYDWTTAGQICSNARMRLATITSRSQSEALKNAYGNYFTGYHWTAANDASSRGLHHYKWNGTDISPNPEFLEYDITSPIQCLAFNSAAGDSKVKTFACTTRLKVLCETYLNL